MTVLLSFGRSQQIAFILGCLLAGAIIFLFGRLFSRPAESQQNLSRATTENLENFIKSHWQRPIPPQGPHPTFFGQAEASLRSEACGSCHPEQYADWRESLHHMAMGPGPWGIILDSQAREATECMTCHAPLSEQMPFLLKSTNDRNNPIENPHFDSELQLQGITCAGCHVRRHRRYGPPKPEGAAATGYPLGMRNHGGAVRTPFFESAEFCRDCHQFDPKNTLLLNGKPLQDTYREWQASSWGKAGAACQECHMPNRRHLWKGIHDAEWVRSAVRMDVKVAQELHSKAGLEVMAGVTNAAVGHKFPTYVTPKVFLRAALLDRAGNPIAETQQEVVIGWDARHESGEWKEYFDTRIGPGEKFQRKFHWTELRDASSVRVWIEVHPDHFYHVHFYPAYLRRKNLSPKGKELIEQALKESGRTPYILFDQTLPLR